MSSHEKKDSAEEQDLSHLNSLPSNLKTMPRRGAQAMPPRNVNMKVEFENLGSEKSNAESDENPRPAVNFRRAEGQPQSRESDNNSNGGGPAMIGLDNI